MKGKIYLLLTFTLFFSAARLIAQTDSAVWALTTTVPTNGSGFTYTGSFDSAAYSTAGIIADTMVVSNMKGGYSPAKFKPSTGPNAAVSGGTLPGYPTPYPEATYSMWRITNIDQGGTAGAWPAETEHPARRYFQFSVAPAAGKTLYVSGFRLPIGGATTGNLRLDIYYSTTNFADSTLLAFAVPMAKDTMNIYNYTGINKPVHQGEKFSVRIYPWFSATSAGSTKAFWTEDVSIYGTAVLPVTIVGANAFLKEKGVQVEWSTATESNVDKYIIERSFNGREFAAISSVTAKNDITGANYSFFDGSPLAGVNYYRIKAVDKDGSYKLTNVFKINIANDKIDVLVAPNPVKGGQLNLQVLNLTKGSYSLKLYNSAGQLVYSSPLTSEGGSLNQSFTLPATAKAGIYNLQVSGGDVKLNKRVVIE
jgi:hypothetical protein